MMKDTVKVSDQLELFSGGRHIVSPPVVEKEVVRVEGFFSAVCRERGKLVPGTHRSGKNIWTLTGSEYLPRLMSYAQYNNVSADVPARNDRIRYVGFGIGTQPEVTSVTSLVSPVAYDLASGGLFLAELAIPTYPFQTSIAAFGNAVRYAREFAETELSILGSIVLTEAGLYTDGAPEEDYAPETRNLGLAEASNQAPVAYKTFEPLKKTQNFTLTMMWEVRF